MQPTCATTGEAAAVCPENCPKKQRPDRRGTALIITDGEGQIIVERRPDESKTGGGDARGLDVFPGSAWANGSRQISDYPITDDSAAGQFKAKHQNSQRLNQQVEHIFSHFRVILDIEKIEITTTNDNLPADWRWVAIKDLPQMALPTVMVKTARLAGVWQDPKRRLDHLKAKVLMPKMAHPCKDHGQPRVIGGGNHVIILNRPARLNHRCCACVGGGQQTISKREKRIQKQRQIQSQGIDQALCFQPNLLLFGRRYDLNQGVTFGLRQSRR